MTDITKCVNKNCSIKYKCFRFTFDYYVTYTYSYITL